MSLVPNDPNTCSRRYSDHLCNSGEQMIVNNDSSKVSVFILCIFFWNFFFLNNCSGPFISKNIILIFWTAYTFFRLWLLIFNTKVIIGKVILILLNLFDKSHIDEIFNLLLLVVSPFIKWLYGLFGAFLLLRILVRVFVFVICCWVILRVFEFLLMFLSVIIL